MHGTRSSSTTDTKVRLMKMRQHVLTLDPIPLFDEIIAGEGEGEGDISVSNWALARFTETRFSVRSTKISLTKSFRVAAF